MTVTGTWKTMLPVIVATVLLAAGAPARAQDAGPRPNIPSELLEELSNSFIFVFDGSVAPADVQGQAASLAAAYGASIRHVYSASIQGFSAKIPAEAAARLAAQNPQIAYYEADGPAWAIGGPVRGQARPSNPGNGNNGGGGDTAECEPQTIPWGVSRVGGPSVAAAGLTAWIIDTGVDLDHPDLNVDVLRAANFSTGKKADDGYGHGTHVAGTIGAIDDACYVVGIAAGIPVVPVRVLNNAGSGFISDVIAGVDYVAASAQPGDVANMSLGGGASTALDEAVITTAGNGVLFAIAAGNSGDDANHYSPARVEHANVYTVSAINSGDGFASFSNWGNPPIDFAAPGVSIRSTFKGGGLATLSGTSMAAPHVAGVLLVTGGFPNFDGCAIDDPDGSPDPVVHIDVGAGC